MAPLREITFQNLDGIMRIHHGLFSDNGRAGYLLHPHHWPTDARSRLFSAESSKVVKIQLISARSDNSQVEGLVAQGAGMSCLVEAADFDPTSKDLTRYRAYPILEYSHQASLDDGVESAESASGSAPITRSLKFQHSTFEIPFFSPVGSVISIAFMQKRGNYSEQCLAFRSIPLTSLKLGASTSPPIEENRHSRSFPENPANKQATDFSR